MASDIIIKILETRTRKEFCFSPKTERGKAFITKHHRFGAHQLAPNIWRIVIRSPRMTATQLQEDALAAFQRLAKLDGQEIRTLDEGETF